MFLCSFHWDMRRCTGFFSAVVSVFQTSWTCSYSVPLSWAWPWSRFRTTWTNIYPSCLLSLSLQGRKRKTRSSLGHPNLTVPKKEPLVQSWPLFQLCRDWTTRKLRTWWKGSEVWKQLPLRRLQIWHRSSGKPRPTAFICSFIRLVVTKLTQFFPLDTDATVSFDQQAMF